MRRGMRKPWELHLKRFNAWLIELNNYLILFPTSRSPKKIPSKELNKIPLHDVPNRWATKACIQGWDFEGKSYKETYKIFEWMEIA